MMFFERLGRLGLLCTIGACSPGETVHPARAPSPPRLSPPARPRGPRVLDAVAAEAFERQLAHDHPHALAFRTGPLGLEFVDECQLYTPPPKLVVSMDGTPEQATAMLPVSSATIAMVFPGMDLPDRRAVTLATRSWNLPKEIHHGRGCAGVTHATVSLRQGSWVDPGPNGESPCLSHEEFDHPNDALTTTCPQQVLAIELRPIRLAAAGAESRPILEPMVEIAAGIFDGERIETFWIDRDEAGDGAYARCVRAGDCPGDAAGRSSPFASGPAQRSADEAEAYCAWLGKRLPTLREWRWVARGREEGREYPWGDELPDASRANAIDKAHALFVPTDQLDPGDPRMQLGWVEQRWAGMWTHIPAQRGTRPLGESRDGVRDLIGNVQEAVRLDQASDNPIHVYVGGGSHHDLPDNHNVALTGDPAEDEQMAPFRERALMPLSSVGYSPDFDLGGSFGFRCASEHEPDSPRLQAHRVDLGTHQFLQVPGLRRLVDAKQACSASDSPEQQWRLPTSAELDQIATDLRPGPHWTGAGQRWQENRTPELPVSARSTARVLCLPEQPKNDESTEQAESGTITAPTAE